MGPGYSTFYIDLNNVNREINGTIITDTATMSSLVKTNYAIMYKINYIYPRRERKKYRQTD